MDFRYYTDNLIEDYFDAYKLEDPNFFSKLEDKLKVSQKDLNIELENLLKLNETHSKKIQETKDTYVTKLDEITNQYNNFEVKVDSLNKHYSEKLSYISVLSKNLSEFEIFSKNIDFASRIFGYMQILNTPEIEKVMPDIFTNPDKIVEEGVEIFEALRQLIDISNRDYPYFVSNFNSIQKKILDTVKDSIKSSYENNELNKLERIMKVTDIINSDFIIDMYVDYILDTLNLGQIINSIKDINFNKISEQLLKQIFGFIDDFQDKIIKSSIQQFGKSESKIYLIFPESKQKMVISSLLAKFSKNILDFRSILVDEKVINEEIFVKIVEYIYPKSLDFTKLIKEALIFSKTDLWNNLEQDNSLFLRKIEGLYMDKEKKLIENFLKINYREKLKVGIEFQKIYLDKKNKTKINENMEILEKSVFEIIESTSFSHLSIFSTDVITRSNNLLSKKEESQDQIETFCKYILDFLRDLLEGYSNMLKFIILEKEKLNMTVSEPHYFMFARLSFLAEQFKNIFIYDLKDLMKKQKLYEDVEELVTRRSKEIGNTLDILFSQISSYISSSINQILKIIKTKEIYFISESKKDIYYTIEFDSIQNSLRPLFSNIMENWPQNYKNQIFQLITKILVDKFIDILKNSKFNEVGIKTMKNDFLKIQNVYNEFNVDSLFYNQINEVIFLIEIFNVSKDSIEEFISSISNRYDSELLKLISKKRKSLK